MRTNSQPPPTPNLPVAEGGYGFGTPPSPNGALIPVFPSATCLGPNALDPFDPLSLKPLKAPRSSAQGLFECVYTLGTQTTLYGQQDVGYLQIIACLYKTKENTEWIPEPLSDVYNKPVKSQGLHSVRCPVLGGFNRNSIKIGTLSCSKIPQKQK